MFRQDLLKRNKEILSSFLVISKIPIENRIPPYMSLFGYIYCIENTLDHKKYIGSVYSNWTDVKNPNPYNPLRKRASHYLYEYNNAIKQSASIKKIQRPIIQILCNIGIENFIMYPIAETMFNNHAIAEKYFIEKFNTINNGYNTNTPKANIYNHKGRVLSKKDKILRSDPIIAINLNNKEIIRSDSMKLLADYLNTSKDIIKNNNRSGRSHKGWFIFYTDDIKRNYILNHYVLENNLGIQKQGTPRYHSDKSKQFYSDLFNNITSYLKDYKSELFPDFKILSELRYE